MCRLSKEVGPEGDEQIAVVALGTKARTGEQSQRLHHQRKTETFVAAERQQGAASCRRWFPGRLAPGGRARRLREVTLQAVRVTSPRSSCKLRCPYQVRSVLGSGARTTQGNQGQGQGRAQLDGNSFACCSAVMPMPLSATLSRDFGGQLLLPAGSVTATDCLTEGEHYPHT
jgi:hypothetical protein